MSEFIPLQLLLHLLSLLEAASKMYQIHIGFFFNELCSNLQHLFFQSILTCQRVFINSCVLSLAKLFKYSSLFFLKTVRKHMYLFNFQLFHLIFFSNTKSSCTKHYHIHHKLGLFKKFQTDAKVY